MQKRRALMNEEEITQIQAYKLLTMADDELILGHRNSEWCGHAPILEEDIAFANISLDEIGHAIIWYQLHADLVTEDPDTYPDQLVYFRDAPEFRCAQFVTFPKGDWAFTIVRQYLFDMLEAVRLEKLTKSTFTPLAEAASKILSEEIYHLRHTSAWMKRLGLGTEESSQRMQVALNKLWPFTRQLLNPVEGEEKLVDAGIFPDPHEVSVDWEEQIRIHLEESGLTIPDVKFRTLRRDQHSQYLIDIIGELQEVARLDPEAEW